MIRRMGKTTREQAEAAGHCKTPLLAVIQAKCLECCAGEWNEVKTCHLTDCPNWPYRLGNNPFTSRTGHAPTLRTGTTT